MNFQIIRLNIYWFKINSSPNRKLNYWHMEVQWKDVVSWSLTFVEEGHALKIKCINNKIIKMIKVITIIKIIKMMKIIKITKMIKIIRMIKMIKIIKIIKIIRILIKIIYELHVLPLWRSVINWHNPFSTCVHFYSSISCLGWN